MNKKNILIIIGSMRAKSLNKQLGKVLEDILKSREDVDLVTTLDYSKIPFMNQDIEFPTPDKIADVRKHVEKADGIFIVSPEYNHSIPGVLKNLLDWLSRPVAPGERAIVFGKPVSIMGAAGMSGSNCVQDDLVFLLNFMNMKLMMNPRLTKVLSKDEYATDVIKLNEFELNMVEKQVSEFIKFIDN